MVLLVEKPGRSVRLLFAHRQLTQSTTASTMTIKNRHPCYKSWEPFHPFTIQENTRFRDESPHPFCGSVTTSLTDKSFSSITSSISVTIFVP